MQSVINYKSQRGTYKYLQHKWLVSLKCKEHFKSINIPIKVKITLHLSQIPSLGTSTGEGVRKGQLEASYRRLAGASLCSHVPPRAYLPTHMKTHVIKYLTLGKRHSVLLEAAQVVPWSKGEQFKCGYSSVSSTALNASQGVLSLHTTYGTALWKARGHLYICS